MNDPHAERLRLSFSKSTFYIWALVLFIDDFLDLMIDYRRTFIYIYDSVPEYVFYISIVAILWILCGCINLMMRFDLRVYDLDGGINNDNRSWLGRILRGPVGFLNLSKKVFRNKVTFPFLIFLLMQLCLTI